MFTAFLFQKIRLVSTFFPGKVVREDRAGEETFRRSGKNIPEKDLMRVNRGWLLLTKSLYTILRSTWGYSLIRMYSDICLAISWASEYIRIFDRSFLELPNIFRYFFGQFLSLLINLDICLVNSLASKYILLTKSWDPNFLIRAIGLSEKLVISFGFVLSNLGLKSQNLQVHPTKCYMLLSPMFPYFRFVLWIFTIHLTTRCIKCILHMKNHIE